MTRPSLDDLRSTPAPDLWPEIEGRLGATSDLERARERVRGGRRAQRWLVVAASLAATVLVFVLLADAFLKGSGRPGSEGPPPAAATPPGTPTAITALGISGPWTPLESGRGALWIGSARDSSDGSSNFGEVLEVRPSANRVVATIPVPARPVSIAVGGGYVWAALATEQPSLVQIDPVRRTVVRSVQLPEAPTSVAVGDGSVYVSGQHTLTRIHATPAAQPGSLAAPFTVQVELGAPVPDGGDALIVAFGGVWAISSQGPGAHPFVERFDPATLRLTGRIGLRGFWGADLVGGSNAVWAVTKATGAHGYQEDLIYRVDPVLGTVGPAMTFGTAAIVNGLVPRGGRVWVFLGVHQSFDLGSVDAASGRAIGTPEPLGDRSGTSANWQSGQISHQAAYADGSLWLLATPPDTNDPTNLLKVGFCSRHWIFWTTCVGVP